MHFTDIKRHLKAYGIHQRRKTTINHAFASAIAPCDEFDPDAVKKALSLLGQDAQKPLSCVYCDAAAETWDHVFATVKNSEFSGAGHRLGNLLPCCKQCNSKKGNKDWELFVMKREPAGAARDRRLGRIRAYLSNVFERDEIPTELPEYARYMKIKTDILEKMKDADKVAAVIRERMKEKARTR